MKSARSEQEFQNLGRRLELALDASKIGVWEHDLQTDELRWDAQMHRLYGTSQQRDTVSSVLWTRAIHPDDIDRANRDFEDAIKRRGEYSSDFRIILPNGEIRHLRSRAHYFSQGGHDSFIGAEWDVTADVLLNRELVHQRAIAELRAIALETTSAQVEYVADHDYLTGLANRRLFDRRFSEMAADETQQSLAILHIDLDGFKQVNDAAGHAAGDMVLRSSTERINAWLPEGAFAARMGGDEFAILLTDFGSQDDLETGVNLIVQKLAQTVWHNGEALHVTASIGVAATANREFANLLAESDIALYRAKRSGRGRAAFFSAQMRAQVVREKRVAEQFTRGLRRGELVPHYQAQVDAVTRRIVGVEALARWRHPRRGVLMPGEFMPVAASLGLMVDLDAIILKAVLADRRNWESHGVCVPRIAVNVSAARLSDPTLIDHLRELDIRPGTVSFELLETIFLDDVDDGVLSNIVALKNMGIDLEIDDFGSGHASIIGLMKLKPTRLKIDRRLVQPITTSREQKRLLRSIVDIAKALNIEIVAEGVETPDHARLLKRLGCDVLQGYAIAYPVSADEMLARLADTDDLSVAI